MSDIEEVKNESFILIRFRDEGDAHPEIYFNRVNAFQIMGAASSLEVYGKNAFIAQEAERQARQREMQLAVPKPEILISRK